MNYSNQVKNEGTEIANQQSKKIILALRKVMQHMDHHSRYLNKYYGLTIPQMICLHEIYENGFMNLSSLSKKVYLSMSTLVGVIDRLEEKNFVHRVRDKKDRRNTFIDITEKGKEFIAASPHLLHNRLNQNLQALTENEQKSLASSIELLVSILKE
ncbi:MarR family winged helix-turn-helix transcriptional regulator [Legionella micdadei]|uniref:DNA-binding transcriptional regulator, MarR family n=1 Tax=Legionella micdadei TaxID=451 RepID=A0A098GF40_LEGMI|nr:MarR family transcriptional regulator [Legionella micdadei]ARG97782.1 MarR family transcriptional regulator [Legionella micdadei]ARG99901.1 MarR family transcriptional regulator [Legionella micdadei]KTD28493.1 transcriptional regulator, MarR family [Legionella micdadei]NSL18738.1 MarR family transcriptional regulator [Legionella micdadei]CEG60617.1 MarR family transcriptional regulator [Legionella micdadei]